MDIQAINALAGLRATLETAPGQREEVYRRHVVEPLRPVWEPLLPFARRGGVLDPDDPGRDALRYFRSWGPGDDAAHGLRLLDRLDAADSWSACREAVEDAFAVLRPDRHGVDLQRVAFTLMLSSDRMESVGGYTGFGGRPGVIWVHVWPTDDNLPRLPSATAHEANHNVRLSVEPWKPDIAIGQYVVLEGLAEAFAAELYGEDRAGPWALALSDAEIEDLKPRLREALDETGFDRARAWIFGDSGADKHGYEPAGVPDFAGYALGYRLVRSWIRCTRGSAAEATYVPWRRIVEQSGFF